MHKRKIDVNGLKRDTMRGKKCRNINVKYEAVFSYFKQKEMKQMKIFQISFNPLIEDLLKELLSAEIIYKMETKSKEPMKLIESPNDSLRLETFYLKGISKEYPIQEICDCLYLERRGEDREVKILGIHKNKLMIFFNQLRLIYADFCYCAGERYILEDSDMKRLYENYKSEWSKKEEKGGLGNIERLEKKICRSLFFLGVLIENNIYGAIERAEQKKREENDDLGTKSEKKKNIKGINQNHQSSTYSFGSTDLISNFSLQLRSQKSNEDDYHPNSRGNYYPKNLYSEYSEKSERIVSKSKYEIFSKAEIKGMNMKIKRSSQNPENGEEANKFEINYLSNDVENILIEQAFKIRKFKDSLPQNQFYPNTYENNFNNSSSQIFYNNPTNVSYMDYYERYPSASEFVGQGQPPMMAMNSGGGYNGGPNNVSYQQQFSGSGYFNGPIYNFDNTSVNSGHSNGMVEDQGSNNIEVNQIKRSLDFYNLVETRKNPYRISKKKEPKQRNK